MVNQALIKDLAIDKAKVKRFQIYCVWKNNNMHFLGKKEHSQNLSSFKIQNVLNIWGLSVLKQLVFGGIWSMPFQ